MKNTLLSFLFVFLLIPGISTSAELRTLEIEFSFTAPVYPNKHLVGYRLYKENEQVCQTENSGATTLTCDFLTEDGTFDFTLTTRYSDDTESPPSPPFQYTIGSYLNHTPEPPTAALSSSTAVGNAPLTITFGGTSSTTPNPPIMSYSWTFGDGSQATATGKTVSHTYSTAGTYRTELTVTDSLGLTDKIDTPVIVLPAAAPNEKPIAIISTGPTEGNAPLIISFDGSQSSDPDGSITRHDWNFGDGTIGTGPTVQHTYTDAALYTMSLQVTDNMGGTATVTREITSSTAPPETIPTFEIGEISIDHQWVKVPFENNYNQPIVIAGPPTFSGSNPVLVRIRSIDQDGFDVRLQEWDYLDDNHVEETFNYIVMEKGTYTLDSGIKIEAGSFTGSAKSRKISLQQKYGTTPVILTQIITENDTDAVTGRIFGTRKKSFKYLMQEQETTRISHAAETIGYIAWEPGIGEISGLIFETGKKRKKIKHKWRNLTFKAEFPDLPLFIADMQTARSKDTAALRAHGLSRTSTQIKIEEEQSKNREIRHKKETIGYLVIGSATAAAE